MTEKKFSQKTLPTHLTELRDPLLVRDPQFGKPWSRCPNGEFRLCCLYSPLCPSLSLLSPPFHSLFPAIPSLHPSLPPSLPPSSLPLFPLSLSLSLSQSPIPRAPHPFSLFSFYCFCLFAFLCVCERESV